MIYAEAAYFDRNHCQHVADRDDFLRLERIRKQGRAFVERRRNGRGIRP